MHHMLVNWHNSSAQLLSTILYRQAAGADVVVALTHMRWPSDEALAAAKTGIDLILGGHDHDVGRRLVEGTWIVKSGSIWLMTTMMSFMHVVNIGTDFRALTCVELALGAQGVQCEFGQVNMTADCPEDPDIAQV